jgi:hypothetical protein
VQDSKKKNYKVQDRKKNYNAQDRKKNYKVQDIKNEKFKIRPYQEKKI